MQKLKKGNMTVYVLLLVAVTALMLLMRHCSAPVPVYDAEANDAPGTLRVAIEYSPLGVESDTINGSLTGFGYEMMRVVADSLGRPVRFIPVNSLGRALEEFDNGRADIVIAEFPMTADYRRRYRFSEPVYLDRQVLVQRRDNPSPVKSQFDIAHHIVAVVSGSPAADRMASLAREIGDTIAVMEVQGYGTEQLLMLVAAREVELAVINASTANRLAPDFPEIDFSTAVSFTQFQPWVVSDSLSAEIDSALKKIKRTPIYPALLKRYSLKEAL